MKYIVSLVIIILSLSLGACKQKPRGPRPMTHEDSVKRAYDAALDAYLDRMSKVRDDLEGPVDLGTGSGEVSKGEKFKTSLLSDSMTAVTTSFERYSARIKKAQTDSTTVLGPLLSRFKVLDSQHKYLAATYSSTGHLLTFHSDITKDDKHELVYDFYFDKGKLRYIREQRTYSIDDDEQDLSTDDSYFMSGATVLYFYRDEGHAQQQKDRMELMNLARYSLRGDISGHVARVYQNFLKENEILIGEQLEQMVYTPPVKIKMPEIPDKKSQGRGKASD